MDRDEFMELVYETFADEPDNVLANGIIEAADAYAEHEKAQLSCEGTTSDRISGIDTISVLEIFTQTDTLGHTPRQIVEALPSAQPELRWIPCSDRLPYAECGESDNVLATCGYRYVEDGSIRWIKMLYFNGGNWCYPTGETYLEKVYAWMPLPEPYRGDM